MRRVGTKAVATFWAVLLCGMLSAPAAVADFGLSKFDVQFNASDSTPGNPLDDPPATQAGSHPFALTTHFEVNFSETSPGVFLPDAKLKDLIIEQVKGFSGDASAVPHCSTGDFIADDGKGNTTCPNSTVLGVAAISLQLPPPTLYVNVPVVSLEPPPGAVARIGFKVLTVPQIIDVTVKHGGDYNAVATSDRISQMLAVLGGAIQLWGVPADPIHDNLRGTCITVSGNSAWGKSTTPLRPLVGNAPPGSPPSPS